MPLTHPTDVERALDARAGEPALVGIRHLINVEPDADWIIRPDVLTPDRHAVGRLRDRQTQRLRRRVKRRVFIKLLGGATAWPLVGTHQQHGAGLLWNPYKGRMNLSIDGGVIALLGYRLALLSCYARWRPLFRSCYYLINDDWDSGGSNAK